MRLFGLIFIIFTNILVPCHGFNDDPLRYPHKVYSASGELFGTQLLMQHPEFQHHHKHTNHNPKEKLIKAEYYFLLELGTRLEILIDTYKRAIKQTTPESQLEKPFKRLTPRFDQMIKDFEKSLTGIRAEMDKILKKYDKEDFTIPLTDPMSFTNKDRIESLFKLIIEVYEIVVDILEKSQMNEEQKQQHIWAVKRNTVLIGFSMQIKFLKMVYDIGRNKGMTMSFVLPGIMYLLVFEAGIVGKVLREELETEFLDFNKFMENYHDAASELMVKAMFHIWEDELPLEENERCYNDIKLMRADIMTMIEPLLTLNGMKMKEIGE